MPRMDSPVRRVLGDKPTNASIKSLKNAITWKNPASSRDSLSISFADTTRSPNASHTFKSPRVGQKRRIEEVEEAERNESQQSTDTQRLSQATDFLSDGSLDPMVDSATSTRSTAQTSLTSFHASQTEPEPAEAQFEFEIHEEMSQRTLDKMVWCPCEALVSEWCILISMLARDLAPAKHLTASRASTSQSGQGNLTTQCQHV